jgi:hypothetical protein
MAAALVAGFILPIGATLLADAQIPQESATTTKWDLGIWTAGATGEEHTNSLTEAQIWTAGFSLGRRITPEIGSGWRRGSLEYAFDVIPLFVTSGSQRIHGGGFDPVLLRWNSSLQRGRVRQSALGEHVELQFHGQRRWGSSPVYPKPAIARRGSGLVAHLQRQLGSAESGVQRPATDRELPLVQIAARKREKAPRSRERLPWGRDFGRGAHGPKRNFRSVIPRRSRGIQVLACATKTWIPRLRSE